MVPDGRSYGERFFPAVATGANAIRGMGKAQEPE
jgi:hypothetical protein